MGQLLSAGDLAGPQPRRQPVPPGGLGGREAAFLCVVDHPRAGTWRSRHTPSSQPGTAEPTATARGSACGYGTAVS